MRPSGSLHLRHRVAADDDFIASLGNEAFAEYARDGAGSTLSMASRASTLVAETAGRPLGFVVVDSPRDGAAHLSALAVVVHARGRGVGGALLEGAERLCRARGVRRLELRTAHSNLAALELFLNNGFFVTSRNAGTYPRGQRVVSLAKVLSV